MVKRMLLVALVLAFSGILWALDDDTEKATVIKVKVIEDAYLNGIFNVGDPEAIKKGYALNK